MARCLISQLALLLSFVIFTNCASLVNRHYADNQMEDFLRGKEGTVDCLGMGKWTAIFLQWLFRDQPRPTGKERVRFLIYTRVFKSPYQLYTDNSDNEIHYSGFKPQRKTVFIVHGFLAHGEEDWIQTMALAYLAMEDVNVIVVDWGAYSNTFNYYKAVVNAITAAREITKLLKQMVDFFDDVQTWGSVHMIGHSLGSHVCGLVAEELKNVNSNWIIGRITALDPAQPCFVASHLSLHKNDANFVDVIHSNGKMLAGSIGLGLVQPIGHVDFYPNGGRKQPGCRRNSTKWDSVGLPHCDFMEAICSHRRSYEYFIESLQLEAEGSVKKFWAHTWDQSPSSATMLIDEDCNENVCTEMGINAAKYNHEGVFFVTTGSNSPFSVIKPSDRLSILEQLQNDALDQNKNMY